VFSSESIVTAKIGILLEHYELLKQNIKCFKLRITINSKFAYFWDYLSQLPNQLMIKYINDKYIEK
jgi:hypothetical protein